MIPGAYNRDAPREEQEIVINLIAHQIATGDVILALALALLGAAVVLRLVGRRTRRASRFAWQIGVLLALEQAYELTRGRIVANKDIGDVALLNAYQLLDLEWTHGIFIEQRLEHFFLQFGTLMDAIDLFYIIGHVGATIGILVWLYLKRPQIFPYIRNLLMVVTAFALVVFYVYPTAPPRMLNNYGFVDPLELHHLVAAGGSQPGSYTYNPYAAMPSLHVAYALVVALGFFLAERSRRRYLAPLYPLAMAATVLISGNHWVLDVLGAAATVALSATLLSLWSRSMTWIREAGVVPA